MMLFFLGCLLLICVFADKVSSKMGIPALVLFMLIGMVMGSDGIFRIEFDNYILTEQICSIALIFIMFYGGFNLKWKYARKTAPHAICLSSAGVLLTTLFCTLLLHYICQIEFIQSFLISAVLGSTDAASVFAILRRKNLNLKYDTAPLLEMESGSNDPFSYMLTMIGIEWYLNGSFGNIALTLLLQIGTGLAMGFLCAWLTKQLFSRGNLISMEFSSLAMIGMVILCYGASSILMGNAYLSVYVMGIAVGNQKLPYKTNMISFFDGLTSIAQVIIFFLLGLLSFPSQMAAVLPLSIFIFLALLVAARPLAVIIIGLLFHSSIRQSLLICIAGLRGAASCVFAVMAVSAGVVIPYNLFQIVFVVTLFSVSIQGSLLGWAAQKLDMIDENEDVRKTFNDYIEEDAISLMHVKITADHPWRQRQISQIPFAANTLALMIERDSQVLVCKGSTMILEGDILILGTLPYKTKEAENLEEIEISNTHPWAFQTISKLSLQKNELIALLVRDETSIIPDGQTTILPKDKVILLKPSN